ncbi:MAG: methyltransferase [Lactobacillaceae bacterium]|jgi:16S rRNA (guanine1207-N2)-methyltransferase|nr:methyltransferase [Lactobacillaceae bacterium]
MTDSQNNNEQYFTSDPKSNHHYYEIDYEIDEVKFKFKSDNGVFSKKQIDFGSNLLIESFLDDEKKVNGDLLDLGTGYGVVGVTIGKILGLKPDMVDVNNRSLELAKYNLENNNTLGNVFYSNIYSDISKVYDNILVNPPVRAGKKIVSEMLEKAYDYLKINGALYVVLQRKQGSPSAQKLMEVTFGNVEKIRQDHGYNVLKSVKYE